jgi:Rod binding domain-containing protein
MTVSPIQIPQAGPRADGASNEAALRDVARALEASFVAEMLRHAGFGESRESFGGGAGEDQFASMLRAEHARALVERGGIGLAESLFQSLVRRDAALSAPDE